MLQHLNMARHLGTFCLIKDFLTFQNVMLLLCLCICAPFYTVIEKRAKKHSSDWVLFAKLPASPCLLHPPVSDWPGLNVEKLYSDGYKCGRAARAAQAQRSCLHSPSVWLTLHSVTPGQNQEQGGWRIRLELNKAWACLILPRARCHFQSCPCLLLHPCS